MSVSSKRQGSHQKAASSTSLASLFAPSSAGAGDEGSVGLGRSRSDRRRSVIIDGLRSDVVGRSDMRRSSTKESLLNLGEDEGVWLDITGKEIMEGLKVKGEVMKVVKEDLGMEEAVEVI